MKKFIIVAFLSIGFVLSYSQTHPIILPQPPLYDENGNPTNGSMDSLITTNHEITEPMLSSYNPNDIIVYTLSGKVISINDMYVLSGIYIVKIKGRNPVKISVK